MPNTPRLAWPYPAENTDPWFDAFVAMIGAVDTSAYAAREDRNIFVTKGGEFSWDNTTGLLEWDDTIEIITPHSAQIQAIPAGSIAGLATGKFLYVNFTRGAMTPQTLTMSVGNTVPSSDGALLLGLVKDTNIYWRNGFSLQSGTPAMVFQEAGGGGGPLALGPGEMFVGDAGSVAQPVSLSGDVGSVSNTGVVTIANGAITAAKVDLTDTFDFASAVGVVQVQDPVGATDAVNLQTLQGEINAAFTLPSAEIFVGNAINVATARVLSGDATINNTGVLTIANDAVSSAKVLKSDSFDFASAAGIVLVSNPTLPTEAANKQWTEALVATETERTTPLTVWVAQGSPQAEDAPRTLIGRDRWDVPFLTLTAACAAIAGAPPLTAVTLYVLDGYYDENVSVPDGVSIVCLGYVYITRLRFISGGFNSLYRARMYNDGSSVAPNESPLEVDNATSVKFFDVIAEDYLQSTLGADPPMLEVNNSFVEAYNCAFFSFQLAGGVGGGVMRPAVRVNGTTIATYQSFDCTYVGLSNVQTESGWGVELANTHADSVVRIIGGVLRGVISHATASGHVGGIIATAWAGRAEVIGAHFQFGATNGGAAPTSQSPARNESGGTLQLLNCTFHCDSPSATNQGAGAATALGGVLRLLGAVWAYRTTIPARQGATLGTFAHEGTLQDGTSFPLTAREINLASKETTDGTIGGPVGTESMTSILPSEWGENPNRTFKFCAIIYSNNAAKTMTVRLINEGTGAILAAHATTNTSPTYFESAALTIGGGATDLQTARTTYEVEIELTAGVLADKGKLGRAWIMVT